MNSMPFRQLKSFLKILIGVQYKTGAQNAPNGSLPAIGGISPPYFSARPVQSLRSTSRSTSPKLRRSTASAATRGSWISIFSSE